MALGIHMVNKVECVDNFVTKHPGMVVPKAVSVVKLSACTYYHMPSTYLQASHCIVK